jgi:hypothetical protein
VTGDSRHLLTITGNSFQNNIAGNTSNSEGGALDLNYGAVVTTGKATLTRNVCQNNHASSDGESGFGGCIYAQFGVLTLDGNIAIGNTARYGTFLFESGVFTMTNNIVAQNLGGGVLTRGVSSNHLIGFLAHNTIARNGDEGVFAGYYNSGYATLTLVNNIIVNHTTGIQAIGNVATNHVTDHTLFFGNEADTTGSTITNTHVITGSDPRFVNPTGENYHLSCLSPAVDAGVLIPGFTIDIDGESRDDGAPDIGADELTARCIGLYLPVVLK